MIGIADEPRPTGMGIFRAFGPRPASVTRTDLYYGGPAYIAGYCPTSENTLYAYMVEDARDRSALTPAERLAAMRALAAAYHGPWDDIRAALTDPRTVSYTLFEELVVPAPWNRGRVVLIGDAAHACPPTLAQGGAQALEDAAVLTELLLSRTALDDAAVGGVHRPAVRAGEDRRRGVLPARPVAARPRAGRRARPDGHDHRAGQPARLNRESPREPRSPYRRSSLP